jgi:isoleucyl-tRNA synthetase
MAWAMQTGSLGLPEKWLLSKLQGLAETVTDSFDRCRFHEGAKAIDEFIINQLSQTIVPLTRNTIWDDSEENRDKRLAVYAALGEALSKIDVMLHPLSPFVTDYLYLTCFGNKKSVILETWPSSKVELCDEKLENAFDTMKEVVSLANSARNLAGLKRRWPIKEAILCIPDPGLLQAPGISQALQGQLNAESQRIVRISAGSQLERVASLMENRLPIEVNISLIRKNVAPRVKADIAKVAAAFERVDKFRLIDALKAGTFKLDYGEKSVEISAPDVEISYKSLAGYSSSERGDLAVFISTTRDKELTYQGLLRDLARHLQQLRKERQYNPTDIIAAAFVAGLDDDEVAALGSMKEKLTYLVRVKDVELSKDRAGNANYKLIEIDGREFSISVE